MSIHRENHMPLKLDNMIGRYCLNSTHASRSGLNEDIHRICQAWLQNHTKPNQTIPRRERLCKSFFLSSSSQKGDNRFGPNRDTGKGFAF